MALNQVRPPNTRVFRTVQLSFGANQAFLSRRYRDNDADAGIVARSAETAIELTFADKIAPWLQIQPDVQYVWNAEHAPSGSHALVFGLRFRISASGH